MRTDDPARQVGNFRFRLAGILALRECLRFSFAWIMIWAAVVVALRAVFRTDPSILLWGALGLLIAVAVGICLAVRQVPSARAVRAMLDRHGSLGGLLMASEDADIGAWNDKITRVPTPTLQWRPHRPLALLAASLGFLAAAFLAPDRYMPAVDNALEVGGHLQKLTEKIQVLKHEDILPPEKAKALENDLSRLQKEAQGKDPAKTMEALDHLEQSLSKAAAEAAEKAIKQAEKAGRSEKLAQTLQTAQGRMDPKQFAEAMKELGTMAQEAAADSEALSEELTESLGDNGLSAEQLNALGKAMKGIQAADRAKLAKLVEARLIDANELERCDEACQCDGDALIAALGEGDEPGDVGIAIDGDGLPGRGGINRGRGDAAMTWQDTVNKGDAAFKEKVLPPGAASLKESKLVGISVGNPTKAKPGGGSVGGSLASAQAGGGEARTQTILPEHEKTVQRYFDRKKK